MKDISKNSILHTLLVAWKSHEIHFGNYTNVPHSAIFNNNDAVTFWFNGKKYKLQISIIDEIKEE